MQSECRPTVFGNRHNGQQYGSCRQKVDADRRKRHDGRGNGSNRGNITTLKGGYYEISVYHLV